MDFRSYDTLPEEAVKIRKAVFVEEQGFCEEFDGVDACARHLVMFAGAHPVATCRFYEDGVHAGYLLGRIAVVKQYRGQHVGAQLLAKAEAEIRKLGGARVTVHAQARAQRFYEKQGYHMYGEPDADQGCPHVWMSKEIEGPAVSGASVTGC